MSNNLNPPDSSSIPYYVVHYQGRAVAIKRDPDYQATIKLLQKSILKLRTANPQDIVIATILADYGDEPIQVSEEIWPDVVSEVKTVKVALESSGSEHITTDSNTTQTRNISPLQPMTQAASSTLSTGLEYYIFAEARNRQTVPHRDLPVLIRNSSQSVLTFNNLQVSTETIRDFKRLMETTHRIPMALQRLELMGKLLDDDATYELSSATSGVPVDWFLKTRQSIIYLLPPYDLNYRLVPLQGITIQLAVNRNWELSALWPYIDQSLAGHYAQSRLWTVDVNDEILMTDRESGSKVDWLYWDGSPSSDDTIMTQDPAAHLAGTAGSLRSMTTLKPNNSVAVPFGQAETYVSSLLSLLLAHRAKILDPLKAEMNSRPCSHFAIRFLPQVEYQEISQVSIHDHAIAHTLRLVMLYKRLNPTVASFWDSIRPAWSEGAVIWKNIIGGEAIDRSSSRRQVAAVEFTYIEVP